MVTVDKADLDKYEFDWKTYMLNKSEINENKLIELILVLFLQLIEIPKIVEQIHCDNHLLMGKYHEKFMHLMMHDKYFH